MCCLGGNCKRVPAVNNATVKHMYDIHIENNILYYSDWKTGTISTIPLTAGAKPLEPLAKGLVRPSQLVFVTASNTPGVASSSM